MEIILGVILRYKSMHNVSMDIENEGNEPAGDLLKVMWISRHQRFERKVIQPHQIREVTYASVLIYSPK